MGVRRIRTCRAHFSQGGGSHPIQARRLQSVESDHVVLGRERRAVGRRDTEDDSSAKRVRRTTADGSEGIVGDAGVGKSRIIREFTAGVHGRWVATNRHHAVPNRTPNTFPYNALSRMFGGGVFGSCMVLDQIFAAREPALPNGKGCCLAYDRPIASLGWTLLFDQ